MTAPRNPANIHSPWYALRDFLTKIYSNHEMRALVEITLGASASASLPDERIAPQEYAGTLCTLYQRHSGVPTPEFWARLLAERPIRKPEINKLKAAFAAMAHEAELPRTHAVASRSRYKGPALVATAAIAIVTVVTMVYPQPTVSQNIECNDGTISPTCEVSGPGCCSGHKGVRVDDKPTAKR